MASSLTTTYLTGPAFAAFSARVWLRLAARLFGEVGVVKAAESLGRYLLQEGSLSASMPRRLVRHRGHVWAVPDLPPLDGDAFLECLEREVARAGGQARPRPVTAIVSLTGRCPHHCPYCYVDAATRAAEEPTVDLLAETVAVLAEAGVFTFHFSGGEPALRAGELLELLGRCNRPELGFWLLTTGVGLDAGRLCQLSRAGLTGVMISLDSDDPGLVDRIKGGGDASATAVRAMGHAREAGLLVAVNAVMNRALLEEAAFFRFLDTAGALGASFVNCYAPRQQSDALPPALLPFSVAEYRTLDRLCRRCNTSSRPRPLAFTPDLWEARRGCQGGTGFLYIDPAGEMRRCPFLKKSYGNIRDKDLPDIIDRMQTDPESEVCAGNRLLTEALRTGILR